MADGADFRNLERAIKSLSSNVEQLVKVLSAVNINLVEIERRRSKPSDDVSHGTCYSGCKSNGKVFSEDCGCCKTNHVTA